MAPHNKHPAALKKPVAKPQPTTSMSVGSKKKQAVMDKQAAAKKRGKPRIVSGMLSGRFHADTSEHPDGIVVLMGQRLNKIGAFLPFYRMSAMMGENMAEQPSGLLRSELFMFSLAHIGLRQFWDSIESFSKWQESEDFAAWEALLQKAGDGVGVWCEIYKGSREGIYINVPPHGLAAFSPLLQATQRPKSEGAVRPRQ